MTNIVDFLKNYTVKIPLIQRDYAHGRELEKESDIRNNLLDSVFDILNDDKDDKKLILNYIYGIPHEKKIDEEATVKEIILIDGQQRTTTLFLLYLYLAVNAKDENAISAVKGRLSYATRKTSEEFCKFLSTDEGKTALEYPSSDSKSVSERLGDCKKFFLRWRNDPTVKSMLVMLDAIEEKAKSSGSATFDKWLDNLKNIQFSFISLDGFKREEELYSTMNGRGKQLTPFEKLKPTLIKIMKEADRNTFAGEINDGWIPAFWDYAKEKGKALDDEAKIQFAQEHHDEYLYNFYYFVVKMLWAQRHGEKAKKGDAFPSAKDATEKLKKDDDIKFLRFVRKFLRFVMGNFADISGYAFAEDFCEKYPCPEEQVYFTDEPNFVEAICNGKIERLPGLLFWAYLKWRYDKDQSDKEVTESDKKWYYALARDMYADAWDSNTPTSLGKTPKEEEYIKAVYRFEQVLSEKDTTSTQARVFESKSDDVFSILNNPLTNGRSTNFESILDKDIEQFKNNLATLYGKKPLDKKLLDKELLERYQMMCDSGWGEFVESDVLYIPYSEQMLKSLFSLTGWQSGWEDTEGGHKDYTSLLDYLCDNDLSSSPTTGGVSPNTLRYYIENYATVFCGENPYSAFTFSSGDDFACIKAKYGQRATKKQTISPFFYAAKCKKASDAGVTEPELAECIKDVEEKGFSIEKDRASSTDLWNVIYDGRKKEWDGKSNLVEVIEGMLS